MSRFAVYMLITDRLRQKADCVSFDSLLLKETEGVTKRGKLVLFSLKNTYLASSLLIMIVLGKKKESTSIKKEGLVLKFLV
jgi:hypothetical protein